MNAIEKLITLHKNGMRAIGSKEYLSDEAAAELSQLRRDLADAKAQIADLKHQLTHYEVGAEMIIEDEQKAEAE